MIRHVPVSILLWTVALGAQNGVDPSGHWEGAILMPERQLSIEVDLARESSGELTGTVSVPPQNLRGFPLVFEAAQGRSLSFRFRGAPGSRHFQGSLSEDGKAISGNFTQGGFSVPFSLKRTGDARIDPLVKSPPIGKELEGPWSATLEGTDPNGIPRRIVLMLSNQPDGTSTGILVNPDDGLEIPVTSITQQASSITIDLKAVSGAYSGTVNSDGTEMVGTLIQGTAVLPLTFRRSPAPEPAR
jgi:hypothetical protein